MTETLAAAACRLNLVAGFAEVRRLISNSAITVNDNPAKSWDQIVHFGDVIKVGKRRTGVV